MARLAGQSDGLARLQSFVSPYTGVVRGVHETLRTPDDARMTLMGCQIASGIPTTGSVFDLTGGGAAYDRDGALAAALGEAVERYAGTCIPQSEFVLATASEIGPEAVSPERFTLFREDQYAEGRFPFEPFSSDTKLRWVKGWSIPDGAAAYLPLQLAYMVRPGKGGPGEAEIAHGSSNGMALAVTSEEAVLRGLLELIERDAVMLTWADRLVHPRLDGSNDEQLVELERRHFTPAGLEYELIDLSVFFDVPTAMGLMSAAGEIPGPGSNGNLTLWGIGAASAPTMRDAADKALRECFQMRTSLRADLLEQPERALLTAEEVEDPHDHVYFYARPENQAKLDFLLSSEQVRDIGDVPALEGDGPSAWVDAIARRLEARDASAYAVDITPPDVEDAGLRVIHVLSPELQPIDFPHRLRFQGGRRLYAAAHQLGLRDRPLSADDLNPDPHPFP